MHIGLRQHPAVNVDRASELELQVRLFESDGETISTQPLAIPTNSNKFGVIVIEPTNAGSCDGSSPVLLSFNGENAGTAKVNLYRVRLRVSFELYEATRPIGHQLVAAYLNAGVWPVLDGSFSIINGTNHTAASGYLYPVNARFGPPPLP